MLGDLPRYARHVRRFPCEDIAIGAQEVDELAFLFGRELGPDSHHLGWVSGVDSHRLSFLEWAECSRGGWLVAVQDYRGQQLPEPRELGRVDDGSGELEMLVVTREGMREGATHSDDAIQPWYL